MKRLPVLALALTTAVSLGTTVRCVPAANPWQEVVFAPGFVEAHTPGSGAPEEAVPPAGGLLEQLLGENVDLNSVSYVRTYLNVKGNPRAILIFIPGFLGGATTFDPVAKDLVAKFNGNLEVWAVDRRPNQLEDRLGARVAVGSAFAGCGTPGGDCTALFDGAQFYFSDTDLDPMGNFPGPEDLDVNLNGAFDAQLPLEDDFGVTRLPVLFAQDDVRGFMAHWGLDTYFRDWKTLVDAARAIVGPDGVVLIGGHSQGTTWSSTWAAYDFDPDPAVVDAGYTHIDGLVLIEGGGVGAGSAAKPTLAEYQTKVADLETLGCIPSGNACSNDVFLETFNTIPLQGLGTSGEVSAIAANLLPDDAALIQRTPVFGSGLVALLLGAPATNEAVVGLFLDDDFSPIGAFRASIGFTDNGPNTPNFLGFDSYRAEPLPGGLRSWKNFDDPTIPSCALNDPNVSPGCADPDNGPPSNPGENPKTNGVEREVSDVGDFLATQFGKLNGFEWYFSAGRPTLDFSYGRDSSALVAESLAVDPGDEGPLVVTQNANVDIPVLAIGGTNGLTPEAKSFDNYLGSIATPLDQQFVVLLEGYAHLDPISARDNEAVPSIVDFISHALQQALLD